MKTPGTWVPLIVALCLLEGCAAKPQPEQGNAAKPETAQQAQNEQTDLTSWVSRALACVEKIEDGRRKETAILAIAEVQAHADMCKAAAETAKSITDTNKKVSALCIIAQQQVLDNKPSDAKQTFSEALAAARQATYQGARSEGGIMINLCRTGEAQARAGFKEDAAKTFAEVETLSKTGKGFSFGIASNYLARCGMFQEALDAAKQDEYPGNKETLTFRVAEEQAKRGLFRDALETVGTSNARYTEWVLCVIADVQAKAGDKESAKKTLYEARSMAERGSERIYDCCTIASSMARIGDKQGALETILTALLYQDLEVQKDKEQMVEMAQALQKQIDAGNPKKEEPKEFPGEKMFDPWYSINMRELELAENYAQIAQALAVIGEKTEAVALSRQAIEMTARVKTGDERMKLHAWSTIVTCMARAGMFSEAMSAAYELKDAPDGYRAYLLIATSQAERGLFIQAIDTARKIKDPYQISLAFARIALEEAKQGEADDAVRHASEAIEWAKTISDAQKKAQTLREIAIAQVKAGNMNVPAETLNSLCDQPDSARFWYCIGVLRGMVAKMHPDKDIFWLDYWEP